MWLILLFCSPTRGIGISGPGFRSNFFPAASSLGPPPPVLLLVLVGILSGRLWTIPIHWEAITPVLRYALWGTIQQYGLQGYFHNRLSRVISQPLWSCTINAIVFMSFHIPNPVLMVFTLVGGVASSMLFLQSRNLFVLGVFHGALGLLLSNVFPRDWMLNMRVGPGYFR